MNVSIYEHAEHLPPLVEGSFFHSRELMQLYEQTPRHRALMAVATDDDERPAGHLLCVVRKRRSWIPPFFYAHAHLYGDNGCDPSCFGTLVEALTRRLQGHVLYMEVSHLSQKMYGYRQLRAAGFFPVKWMSIHNSLHSRTPEERITPRQMRRIERAKRRGAVTKVVETEAEFRAFSKLLRHHNWLKPRRFIPDDAFFRGLLALGRGRILITCYRQRVIGTAVYVTSGDDAYLLYSAARRKSYATLHPNTVTFWRALCDAHQHGKQHMRFMDVGLPFRRNPYREFILRFGGKEVSTYRWFRISIGWVHRVAEWLWRE